ncbi:NUDIX hydrolase [Heyndrickxia acidiproducens]|uniref:NUDIX hydrolase n=1 Tax=Heyndrickxia acidiproducens TaxID=1121084 RepID=UPI00035D8E21|nr:CoA pyrophosphatase [Heyndrickxia acidiproducens]
MNQEEIVNLFQSRQPSIQGLEGLQKFAVLLPLVRVNGELEVLFEVRSEHLRKQPGEICFPGGKIERTDETPGAAAIRETAEELQIDQKAVTRLLPLDYVVSSFGNRVVYPYFGFLEHSEFHPNPDEVEEIFTIPLAYLMKIEPECYRLQFHVEPEQAFPFHLIRGGKAYKWNTQQMTEYFYYYGDYVIWGLTAGILKNFIDILKTGL